MKKIILTFIICLIATHVTYAENDNNARKLLMAEKIIENFYVDSIDEAKIVEQGIIAMLKELDPHSIYTDKAETKELTTPLQGNFSGIGIQFQMLNDTLLVIQTISGGPCEKVGILPGDKIITAGDSIISGVKRPHSSILEILRGPKGTDIDVSVMRKGEQEPIIFRITRDNIPIYSVDATYMVNSNTGYIRVARFAESTGEEFHKALITLKKKGMKNLIVDLEDNGGGFLGAAVELASEFLNPGDIIVSTKAARTGEYREFPVETKGIFREGKLVVMTNQFSASASEIFSGAIQDHDRGIIVGRRTFGKGLVQRPFPFPDGTMIRLTVSRYMTPSGRLIQKPYKLGESEEYRDDILHRYDSGEFTSADSIHFDESLKAYTLHNHRLVYGGGGIMPDKFVPIDTTGYSNYYRNLIAKGALNKFVVTYVDNNRDTLKKQYKNINLFIDNFVITDDMLRDLVDYGQREGAEYVDEDYVKSKTIIMTVLKGLIARDLFDTSAYFQIVNPLNPIFNKALEVISDDSQYDKILTETKQ